ncbi:MAG: hypothetical protein PHC88_06470 [Terrimicrobiaceae bacterium]|nr:hypothetical protein [Terrimicrobiaceae bacterium]
MPTPRMDQPEPWWQALLAMVAVGGISASLPEQLTFGPRWLLSAVIVVLLAPTVFAHHTGRYSLNHALGIFNNAVITLALISSLVLLVAALPAHKQAAVALLRSAATLWVTNVLVFALWYWRLDGGGPVARHRAGGYGSASFLFPQQQIEKSERASLAAGRWSPMFVDYLFVAFNTSAAFSPTDTPVLARWAKLLNMAQGFISLTIVALLVSRAAGVM